MHEISVSAPAIRLIQLLPRLNGLLPRVKEYKVIIAVFILVPVPVVVYLSQSVVLSNLFELTIADLFARLREYLASEFFQPTRDLRIGLIIYVIVILGIIEVHVVAFY